RHRERQRGYFVGRGAEAEGHQIVGHGYSSALPLELCPHPGIARPGIHHFGKRAWRHRVADGEGVTLESDEIPWTRIGLEEDGFVLRGGFLLARLGFDRFAEGVVPGCDEF